jgi:hypothetical protein
MIVFVYPRFLGLWVKGQVKIGMGFPLIGDLIK